MSKKAKWLDTLEGDDGFDTAITPSVRRGKSSASTYTRCFETHPPLVISPGVQIYGGSCSSPIVPDADVYVGLDMSMKKSFKAYPWEPGESFLYYIPDMQAPGDPESFAKLIDWLAVQLAAQMKVHVGCLGGHGRTGTVFSALVNVMTGEKDAIQFVRDHYCQKVVESQAQVDFLHKYFGITKATPAKTHLANAPWIGGSTSTSSVKWPKAGASEFSKFKKDELKWSKGDDKFANTEGAVFVKSMRSNATLFGPNAVLTN